MFKGHLVDYEEWEYFWNYENYGMQHEEYIPIPSRKECEEMCKKHSGEVIVYKMKKTPRD